MVIKLLLLAAVQLQAAKLVVTLKLPVPPSGETFAVDGAISNVQVGVAMNWAITVLLEFIIKVAEPVPNASPLHPTKAEPSVGTGVRVTETPLRYVKQPSPQLIPSSVPVT